MISASKYTREQERQFDNMLRAPAIRKKYKTQRGADGIWEILCKRGDIEPYSLTELCCYQSFGSGRGVKALLAKMPPYCKVTQQAGTEIVFKFPSDKLDEIAGIVGARRRKSLTAEQRSRLADLMAGVRSQKGLAKTGLPAPELAENRRIGGIAA